MEGQPVTGNTSGIKNTLAKVSAWAKKNPIPAGIIVIVLAVIGWLVYKYFGSQSSGTASAAVDPNAAGTSLDTLGGGALTTGATAGDGSGLASAPPAPISNGGGNTGSGIDLSGFTLPGGGLPIPSVDSFSIPTASAANTDANATFTNPAGVSLTDYLNSVTAFAPSITGVKSGMEKTRSNSAPQWYNYLDSSTYNLPHNPDGSGRPPRGWLPSIGSNANLASVRVASQSVDASMLIPGGGVWNGITTGGKSGIDATLATGATGSRVMKK